MTAHPDRLYICEREGVVVAEVWSPTAAGALAWLTGGDDARVKLRRAKWIRGGFGRCCLVAEIMTDAGVELVSAFSKS